MTKKLYLHFNPKVHKIESKIATVRTSHHCKYDINYHIIWIPKYRKPILTGKIVEVLKAIIEGQCQEMSISNLELEIMPDHLHLFVGAKPTATPFKIIHKLKGNTHDKYEYDEEKDEMIVGKTRFRFKGLYVRKDGKKIFQYWNDKLKKKKDVPFYFRERLRMRDKMKKDESKDVYRLRKCTVEPVIGNIKQNLGFREFLLKGLQGTKIELNLVSIAHNLGKIWRMRVGITA